MGLDLGLRSRICHHRGIRHHHPRSAPTAAIARADTGGGLLALPRVHAAGIGNCCRRSAGAVALARAATAAAPDLTRSAGAAAAGARARLIREREGGRRWPPPPPHGAGLGETQEREGAPPRCTLACYRWGRRGRPPRGPLHASQGCHRAACRHRAALRDHRR